MRPQASLPPPALLLTAPPLRSPTPARPLQPPGGHLSLMAYRTLLEEVAARVQTAWDARSGELARMHAGVQAACAEVDEPVAEAFAAVGEAITTARVAQYEVRARSSCSRPYGRPGGRCTCAAAAAAAAALPPCPSARAHRRSLPFPPLPLPLPAPILCCTAPLHPNPPTGRAGAPGGAQGGARGSHCGAGARVRGPVG